MAISFACECGQEFRVADSHAGKRIKCQGCGAPVKIPALPSKKGAADSGGVAVGKAKKKAARSGDEEEDPLVHSASEYDSMFEFDIGNVPRGKLIEDEEEPAAKKGGKNKSKKAAGKEAEKPKKKKRDDEAGNPLLIAAFVVLGLCSMSALAWFGFKNISAANDTTPIEKKFVTFKHAMGWSLEHPEDWKVQTGGGTGGADPFVIFEGDGAVFRMKGSIGGSALGSIMQSGGGAGIAIPGADADVDVAGDQSPETGIHLAQGDFFKNDYNDFEETPPEKITPPFGEGRISTFTGSDGLIGGKKKGYRATLLANDYQYNIRAYVDEGQWEKFEPTFKRMINSISR